MARDFESGSSQYLEIDSAPLSAAPITVSAWINLESSAARGMILWMGDKGNAVDGWEFAIEATNALRWRCEQGGGDVTVVAGSVGDGVSAHVLGTQDASDNMEAFVNGSSVGTASGTVGTFTADRISIGRDGDSSPGNPFDGTIAEVGIWNVVLSAGEIGALAKGFSPLLIRPDSLVFYLPLIQDDDNDLIGGLHLTAFNTPTIAAHPRIIYPSAPLIITAPAAGEEPSTRRYTLTTLGVG